MSIRLINDSLSKSLKKIEKELQQLPKEMYKVWLDNTPEATGNAKKKTKLSDKTISANYPYAKKLDQGSSKKKPAGMSDPTGNFIKDYIKKALRK
jgi:hypothetical protein